MTGLFDISSCWDPQFGKALAADIGGRGWSSHGLAENLPCHTAYFFPLGLSLHEPLS